MSARKFIGLLAAVVALLATGCAAPGEPPAPDTAATTTPAAESPTPTPPAAQVAGTKITTGDSDVGTVLFDEAGQAIYIWQVEDSSTPQCYGDCAAAWPPVLTDGAPRASGDVDQMLLGTATRSDGTTQVTYNGHPLYYYAHEAPGQVKCHNVATHGGLWWAVQPTGDRAP